MCCSVGSSVRRQKARRPATLLERTCRRVAPPVGRLVPMPGVGWLPGWPALGTSSSDLRSGSVQPLPHSRAPSHTRSAAATSPAPPTGSGGPPPGRFAGFALSFPPGRPRATRTGQSKTVDAPLPASQPFSPRRTDRLAEKFRQGISRLDYIKKDYEVAKRT